MKPPQDSGELGRRPAPDPNWWTGYIEAYLDLRYRWLPEYLRKLQREHPGRRTLSLWQVGYEDGSETFLLAAIVDETLRTLEASARESLAVFAARLRVELRATDAFAGLTRRRRLIRFDKSCGPRRPKFPMVPEDRGAGARMRWTDEVERIEAASLGRIRRQHLRQLGDAGKAALLLSSLLKRRASGGRYEIIDRTWRIEDAAYGPPLNVAAQGRRIRFETEDVTTTSPRAKHDLVICANVLPHLPLYQNRPQRDLAQLRRVCTRLTRAVRPGGALLVDAGTASSKEWGPAFSEEIREMARGLRANGCSLLALDPGGLRVVRLR